MSHVQTHNVQPGEDELAELLRTLSSRTDGGDDFGVSVVPTHAFVVEICERSLMGRAGWLVPAIKIWRRNSAAAGSRESDRAPYSPPPMALEVGIVGLPNVFIALTAAGALAAKY